MHTHARTHTGQYSDDLPHGHGVYTFAAGQRYEGEWRAGRKHGWSVYTVEAGELSLLSLLLFLYRPPLSVCVCGGHARVQHMCVSVHVVEAGEFCVQWWAGEGAQER